MSVRHVIFDIGGVLVGRDPVAAFAGPLGGREAALAFIECVDFRARNVRADLGERFEVLAEEIDDPDDRALFATYVEAYPLTVRERIEGSWALLDRMKGAGVPVHAITNWSAETWPRGPSGCRPSNSSRPTRSRATSWQGGFYD